MEKLELKTNADKVLNSLQMVLLEGLKEIDRICRKHDIKYSLGGGTSLGQLRHGGFIPWDDDIDIDMTLENYDKFLKVAPQELDHNRFFLRCRDTDKKHLRTNSRLEIKYTTISLKNWQKKNLKVGIFIDIMCWCYLPNNKFLRKIVSSSLFYLRCIENYKMFHAYAKKANPKLQIPVIIMGKIVPNRIIFWIEEKLRRCCGHKKTNWIMDDAIINGNHGGYLSEGADEYEDVYFEGIKVMNKKNPHNHMRTIYGENYMEWLPPASRISHHFWLDLDFGIYKDRFDLPVNYKKYLTTGYEKEKLERMQQVSLEMMQDIHDVCLKNNIKYYVGDLNAFIKLNNADEYGTYFRKPFKILMPRKDYEKFNKIAQESLGNKYFYQTKDTDPNYYFNYARVRLNFTYIRENLVPKKIEEKYNNGFFVTIIPLDNTSNDVKLQLRHERKLKKLFAKINLKWQHYNLAYFIRKNIKVKCRMLALLPFSLNHLVKKLDKVSQMYNNEKTNYYINGTPCKLDFRTIEQNILGKGKTLKYFNQNLVFPEKQQEYLNYIKSLKDGNAYEEISSLNYVKKNFKDSYSYIATRLSLEDIKKIQKKYEACFLTYYDLPEYQLSVLRYDPKTNKYLSNEEIINYQKNVENSWKR